MKEYYLKNEINLSKAATVIIFLALVRTLSEPFRLQQIADVNLNFEQIKPFLIAALVCTTGLFAMTILWYYKKSKSIIAIAIAVIIAMVIIKNIYLL